MVHNLPAPAPKRHIARLGRCVTAAAFVSAAIAMPASTGAERDAAKAKTRGQLIDNGPKLTGIPGL
ncbi:hypothetical protein OG444_21155 [Streptomyces sp. NBC_01232]|uniref:hypothetical protein n=1 Tax=unclassified Streptomyces TaxID=2593676 RepID=UPI002E11D59C|nr:hypothetical protein OG444_21155 [Streptomyces sp. NBC_01232]